MSVVGLIGVKGGGKDTLAKFLIENHGYQRLAFADALYLEVSEAFGIPVSFLQDRSVKELPQESLSLNHCKDTAFIAVAIDVMVNSGEVGTWDQLCQRPLSPRQILQWWGTEFRRVAAGDDTYWLDTVFKQILPDGKYVITDVRYMSELTPLTARYSAKTIRIKSDWVVEDSSTSLHPSETELRKVTTDFEVVNAYKNPEVMFKSVQALLNL